MRSHSYGVDTCEVYLVFAVAWGINRSACGWDWCCATDRIAATWNCAWGYCIMVGKLEKDVAAGGDVCGNECYWYWVGYVWLKDVGTCEDDSLQKI